MALDPAPLQMGRVIRKRPACMNRLSALLIALAALAGLAPSAANAMMGDKAVAKMVSFGGSCERCELSGRQLSGARFIGADFTEAALVGSDLRLEGPPGDGGPGLDRFPTASGSHHLPVRDRLDAELREQRAMAIESADVDDDRRPAGELVGERRCLLHLVEAATVAAPRGGELDEQGASGFARGPTERGQLARQLRVASKRHVVGGRRGRRARISRAGGLASECPERREHGDEREGRGRVHEASGALRRAPRESSLGTPVAPIRARGDRR